MRLSLAREEDATVRRWCALGLTRLGEGAHWFFELAVTLTPCARLAALALAEQGDSRGEAALVGWWQDEKNATTRARASLLEALGKIRKQEGGVATGAVPRRRQVRPVIAATLVQIGDQGARGYLARALAESATRERAWP